MRRLRTIPMLSLLVALALALSQSAAAQTATEWDVAGSWTLVFTRDAGCARCPPGPVTYQLTLRSTGPGSFAGAGTDVGNVYGKFNGGAAVTNDSVTVTGTTDKAHVSFRVSYADARVDYTPLVAGGEIASDGTMSGSAVRGGSGAGTFSWKSTAGRATVAPARPAAAAASPSPSVAGGPVVCPATLGGWLLRNDPNDRAYSSIVGKVFRVSDVIAGAQGVTAQLLADTQGWFQLECQYRPPDPKLVPSFNIPYVNASWAESGTGSGGAIFSGVNTLCTGDPVTRTDPQTGASETLLTSGDKRAAAGYATGGLVSDATFRAAAERLLAAASSRAQSCPRAGVAAAVPPGSTSAPAPSEDRTSDTENDIAAAIVSAALDLAADTGVPVTTALITVLSVLLGIPGAADATGGVGTTAAGASRIIDPETGKPFARWQEGMGADGNGRSGKPGDYWDGRKWVSERELRDELDAQRVADAQRVKDDAAFQAGTDEMRERWEAQKAKEAQAGFQSVEERDAAYRAAHPVGPAGPTPGEIRERRAQLALEIEHARSQADNERGWATVFGIGEKTFEFVGWAADTSISILKQYTGPTGRLIAQVYAGAKQGAGDAFDPSKSWSDVVSGAAWASGKAVAGDVLQDVAQPVILSPIAGAAFSERAPVAGAAQWFMARVTFNPQMFDLLGDKLSGMVVDSASDAVDAETWLSDSTAAGASVVADAVDQATDRVVDAGFVIFDPATKLMYGL